MKNKITTQEAVENVRADVAASSLGAEWMRKRAISACTITYTEARKYNLPQMAGGAAKCREDIRAIPSPTPADLLDAAAHAMMKWADAIEWERNDEFEAFKRHCRRAALAALSSTAVGNSLGHDAVVKGSAR